MHRRIFREAYGTIPKDDEGRSFEIHHIDGDHSNNELSNLKAVSIADHMAIHLAQGDWMAVARISSRMGLTSEIRSEMSRNSNLERVANGTHNFLGDRNPIHQKIADGTAYSLGPECNLKRVKAGTHNFLGENNPSHRRVANGTHNFLGPATNQERIANGTHNLVGAKNPTHKRIEDGTYHFLGENNPSHKRLRDGTHNFTVEYCCDVCGRIGKGPRFKSAHFSKCKKNQ